MLEEGLERDEELRAWALPLIRVRDVMRGGDSSDDPRGHGLSDAELDAAGARAIARFNTAVEEELTRVRPAVGDVARTQSTRDVSAASKHSAVRIVCLNAVQDVGGGYTGRCNDTKDICTPALRLSAWARRQGAIIHKG